MFHGSVMAPTCFPIAKVRLERKVSTKWGILWLKDLAIFGLQLIWARMSAWNCLIHGVCPAYFGDLENRGPNTVPSKLSWTIEKLNPLLWPLTALPHVPLGQDLSGLIEIGSARGQVAAEQDPERKCCFQPVLIYLLSWANDPTIAYHVCSYKFIILILYILIVCIYRYITAGGSSWILWEPMGTHGNPWEPWEHDGLPPEPTASTGASWLLWKPRSCAAHWLHPGTLVLSCEAEYIDRYDRVDICWIY